MITKINIWLYNFINNQIYKNWDIHFNPLAKSHLKDFRNIPIIIINFNQLFYLKKLVDFLLCRNFKNIIIIDNKSTYPPLLNYYEEVKKVVTIEYMDDNYGHSVFFKNSYLQKKYGKGFYVVSDADILPNENLSENFLEVMLRHLIANWKSITKVGFALKIDDIPSGNKYREKVLRWESRFWEKEIGKEIYEAPLDTTFAVYKPGYPLKYNQISYLDSHRFGGDFTASHGGWYIDHNNMTEEQFYYVNTASTSSSWLQENKNK